MGDPEVEVVLSIRAEHAESPLWDDATARRIVPLSAGLAGWWRSWGFVRPAGIGGRLA
jgi:hypothetical protein